MTASVSMLNGIFSFIGDFLTGIFSFIPQMMYFIYTCAASILDFLQFVVRKLAGLDVYYIEGKEQTGDLVFSIMKGIFGIEGDSSYSLLSTVFWSMVIFAVLMLVISTILKIIITHYNYKPDESNPAVIIRGALKSLMTIAIVPIVALVGISISNVVLKTLDQISTTSSASSMDDVYGSSSSDYRNVFKAGTDNWGYSTYSSYDYFGFGSYTNMTSISGQLFKTAGNHANRVRYGSYTTHVNGIGDGWSNVGIFNSNASDEATRVEEVASMIDFAFANNLTLKDRTSVSVLKSESLALISSYSYLQGAVWFLGTRSFNNFSKFNVGLVWYYYNLWGFNFFIALAGLGISITLLVNIVFGLITRLITLLALFLVYPVLLGIEPIEGGNAFGSWKGEFTSNVLMAYGAIVGMNIVFMMLPLLQKISFFNSLVPDLIFNMLIMIAALISIKKVIEVFSKIVKAKDANAEGQSAKEEVKKTLTAPAEKVMKVAKTGAKIAAIVYTGGAAAVAAAAKKLAIKKMKEKVVKAAMDKMKKKKADDAKADAKENAKETKKDNDELAKAQQKAEKKEGQNAENENTESLDNQEENKETGNGQDLKELTEVPKKGFKEQMQEKRDDHAEKLSDYGGKLKNFLNGEGKAEDFNKEDQDLAKKSKEKYDKRFESMKKSREKKKGSALSNDELAELKNDVEDSIVEDFLTQSAMTDEFVNDEEEFKKQRVKNASGKVKKKDSSKVKGLNNSFLEIGAEALKVIGSFTKLSSGLKKEFEEAGVFDAGIEAFQEFSKTIKAASPNNLKTKKQKEAEKETKKTREASVSGKRSLYTDAVAKQMKEVADFVKKANEKK